MKDYLDFHTHTIVSGHAHQTMNEMIAYAVSIGLEMYAITEHGPNMPGSCHKMHFDNTRIIDRSAYGLELFMGAEVNILDAKGSIDLPENTLRLLDVVIASMHSPCIKSLGIDGNTEAIINCIKNPYVDIIGHPDDSRYPIDMEAVVKAAKEYGKLLEVNNCSLAPFSPRVNSRENIIEMLNLCKRYSQEIIVDSDAHLDRLIREHSYAYELLAEVDFPEELVVNTNKEKARAHINRYRNPMHISFT